MKDEGREIEFQRNVESKNGRSHDHFLGIARSRRASDLHIPHGDISSSQPIYRGSGALRDSAVAVHTVQGNRLMSTNHQTSSKDR
jgi:hypothetical protein